MSHTPGEWTVHDSALGPFVTAPSPSGSASRITVAVCVHLVEAFHVHQRNSNARLIAAAPDLLEAAKHILRILDHPTDSVSIYDADKLRFAIAKAEGKP